MPAAAGGGSATTRSGRGRVLLPTLLVLLVLIGGFVLFTGYWTDWLWFQSIDKSSVYTTQLTTRILLFAVFGIGMAVIIALNMWLAWRLRPVFGGMTPEQASLDRYRVAIEPFRRAVVIVLPTLLGILAGVSAATEWRTFLQWRNATDFGQTDPQFGIDISYFVFTYPFQRFVIGFLFVAVALSFVAAAVVHYLYGGLRLQAAGERATGAAQAHLSILVGLFLLLKAGAYWLDRYGLEINPQSLVQGFTGMKYTDVNAVLPATTILAFIAVGCAILFFINAFRRTWALALIGLGLMVLSSVLIGWLYPLIVQQFQVRPSELVKEQPYIERNIAATREAYGIADAKVQNYAGTTTTPTPQVLAANAGTLGNIRLLDPAVVSPTYDQLQQVRAYYSFADTLDVDRYSLDNTQRGAVVAVREINLSGLPDAQRNWANDKAVFTHGYGFVGAYDNAQTADGQPSFFESNIPPSGSLSISQPRIYFGELSPPYSIVGAPAGSPPRELDYPDDAVSSGQRNNTYDGIGGVSVGNFFNRLVFATKFQDPNIILSDLVNSESRILWDRDPLTRVEKVAPWLTLDRDPYPAVVDGRIVWIVDGYTTTDAFPYSSQVSLEDATSDSITARTGTNVVQPQDQINYIRNSVKAVVDAYDGTVSLYAWDESDPVLATWRKAFPGVVQDRSAFPTAVEAHVRYPEDIFKVQRTVLSRYHVTDAATFYNATDFWVVPIDPTKTPATNFQPPYYLTLQMPGQDKPSFSLTTTFAPQRRQTLAAFMAVNSTPGPDYGTIRVLQLPSSTTIPGPQQVQNNFESDPDVSQQLSLLRRGGSDVQFGNLLSLPFNDGLLYVEPVYVKSTGASGYPLLRRVLAGYGPKVVLANTLPEALAQVFNPNAPTTSPPPDNGGGSSTGGTADARADLAAAVADAAKASSDLQAAMQAGDWTALGDAQKRLLDAVARAEDAESRLSGPSPSATPSASPSATASRRPTA
ncbi:MAG: UPF0182 family protein [Actinomycetota bacterium]|nr:MAG: UPF0182 family protein [Actinomycetota bacterium]